MMYSVDNVANRCTVSFCMIYCRHPAQTKCLHFILFNGFVFTAGMCAKQNMDSFVKKRKAESLLTMKTSTETTKIAVRKKSFIFLTQNERKTSADNKC